MKTMFFFRKFIIRAAVSAFCLLLWSACDNAYRHDEGMVWHTSYHITYRSDRELADSIIATFGSVGNSLNVFDPKSLTSRVNGSDSVEVDADFIRVYEMSRRINDISGGAFDPTLGPLITAWGFGKGHKASADTLRLDSLLEMTGIARTRLVGNILVKEHRGIQFNFSAIAKGFGCDRVAEMLERNGVKDYLVEIGGEIRCSGKSPSGQKWRIAIDRPVVSDSVVHEAQCVLTLSGMGMATSGNYRNFHGKGNARYGHTISSRTGRPVQTDVLSATVVAPTAMEADALATALMAMDSERGKRLVRKLRLPALLVLADSTVWQSEQMSGLTAEQTGSLE